MFSVESDAYLMEKNVKIALALEKQLSTVEGNGEAKIFLTEGVGRCVSFAVQGS